ncbi:MAG TPA: ABC transporter permease [Actinomycetota bacterium]|nr:ABC transporter permease [Actinomycetota bacterium]
MEGAEARPRGALLRDVPFLISVGIIALLALVALAPGLFGAGDPFDCSLDRSLERPSLRHPFGFDFQGCDYYTLVLYGARSSLAVGAVVVAGTALLGVLVGSIAGLKQGIFDAIVGRLGDAVLAVPLILGGSLILTFIEGRSTLHVIWVLVVLGWPPMARLVRSHVRRARTETYVEAARALGAGDGRLLRVHLLPNVLWPVVIFGASYVAVAVTAEALLSFLGVGLELPAISWGLMLSEARFRMLQSPHLLIPAAFLSATVTAFVFLGEALRRNLDPQEMGAAR